MAEVEQLSEELTTLKRVVQTSLHRGLLAEGTIESKQAKFVVLADDCTEDTYKKLIVALAKQFQIPVWKVEKGALLGEWIGISKFLTKTKKIKSRKCSSVALKDFAIEVSENEKQFVEDKIKGL
ncbi:unnamed protein product (macronuclear) [Paramecium tetraurelia]|uniref:Ribosomal protein eL8/eL30/eS12/Gadd45 domain-containing protein n=1 Tax=Paramecium tetraurelia TaxID=5888 RepID=A0EET8_PARTE|nr:uncharacterized protein GSPATT00026152001 [Paramecium tetraurelia]CAK93829.1 unnamed protein product [Paramecium tetraurelia]|eukprot:XP_001461202.1 hypothetical protein (macronuclear) [Paramecium tetraurelia strain d4-2]